MKKLRLAAVMSTALLLASCGESEPMVSQSEYDALAVELDDAYTLIDGGVKVSDMTESSLKVIEGSTEVEFEYSDNKFILPHNFTLANSVEDATTSKVRVGSIFELAPSDNWTLRLKGTSLHLNHPMGIFGKFTSTNTDGVELYTEEGDVITPKEVLYDYSKTIPTKKSYYHNIALEAEVVGGMVIHEVVVNKANGLLVIGYVDSRSSGLMFSFVLDGRDKDTQLELTKLLISSISSSGQIVSVE